MTWIGFAVALSIAGSLCFFLAPAKAYAYGGAGAAAVLLVVITVAMSVHSVGQTQVGIPYSVSGTISGSPKPPGLVWIAPWESLKRESVAVTKDTYLFTGDNKAVSKDQQPITATVVINYQVTPTDVIGLLKSVGPNWKTVLLDGRVPQDFKETTATFTSPQITQERPRLRTDTLARLKSELCPDTPAKPWCINVVDVFVSNVGYSEEYTKAIEAKQVQVQQSQRAKAKVAQAQYEADQAVATAKGEARSTLVKAQADARALALKGKAIQDHPGILSLEAVDKLNSHATVIFCSSTSSSTGSGTCPSFLPQGTSGR